jgi:hypothetical protein
MNQFGWFQNNEQLPPGNVVSNNLKPKLPVLILQFWTLKKAAPQT